MKKTVFFFSFSRSDYSSLKVILKQVPKQRFIRSKFVVGGSHLSKIYGNTINEIIQDKIKINYKIDYLKNTQKFLEKNFNFVIQTMIEKFSKFLIKNKVKNIFIIGDRWELVPLAISAFNLNCNIIHHSGGDYTFGSKDNHYRTIISILSDLHLVGNKLHKERLIKMGINVSKIHVVGEPSLLNYKKKKKSLKNIVIATLYPSDFETKKYKDQIKIFLNFLGNIKERVILTAPGNEKGSKIFLQQIVKSKRKNIEFYKNLGSEKYNTMMSKAKLMVGNSSSGILEASSYKLPVLNLGNRQKGRLKPINVIDCEFNLKSLISSYKKAKSKNFINRIKNIRNPYLKKNCVKNILKILNKEKLNKKSFNQLIDPIKNLNEYL